MSGGVNLHPASESFVLKDHVNGVLDFVRVKLRGQPRRILNCKGWKTDADAYTCFITQAAAWKNVCDVIGKPEWKEAKGYATPPEPLDKLNAILDSIDAWTKTRFEVMDICNPLDIPVAPILPMREIAEDEGLRAAGAIVEVDHPERGRYLSVGCPIKLSESPLRGEHKAEILSEVLDFAGADLERVIASGAVGKVKQQAAE